ncbi:cobalt ABC transporter ATP-binding protein [Erysipelotrichaceae bacterium]|nr:cobalt ABC transporter ATP-binding protein [Erysipelotrichaceae bacterium]
MKHYSKLVLILFLGVLSLILEFIFKRGDISRIIITITGSIFSLLMFIEMVKTLRSGKYGIDILAITAIIATLAVGEYWASLLILVMLVGGDSLEDYAAAQARSELSALLKNAPQIAHRIDADVISDIAIDDIIVGHILLVKPGELVPVDGIVISGSSDFNEASLTGESVPVHKQVGSFLMSGSINGASAIQMQAQKIASDSQYQKIVQLVKSSEQHPAKFVRLADRYAIPFTVIAYTIAGLAWFISKDPKRFAEVLVVASPCPLILSAPIALVAGMSRSSRNGIIVKTGTTLEKLAKAKTVAFDKTGTLTKGNLEVTDVHIVNGFEKDEILCFTASAQSQSTHILARSLLQFVGAMPLLPARNVEEVTGNGISATISDRIVRIGKLAFVNTSNTQIEPPNIDQTVLFISIDSIFAGYITFSDQARPEAKQTIQNLKMQGIQDSIMVTGDNLAIAQSIGKTIGIHTIYADCLPEDKINIIKNMPESARPIIMVGDGVNDAPALTVADIGIAMGAHGATSASESADCVILLDDLSKVDLAITIAKQTMRIAKQSVLIGIVICTVLMLIASTGVIPALIGALLQEAVDTISILYSLRARRDFQKK